MIMVSDWNIYKNFTKKEFICSHTGLVKMSEDFMNKLQNLRIIFNKPLIINSGYRHPSHPIEIIKDKPGEHSYGLAADISISGSDVTNLIVFARTIGFPRIGVKQSGHYKGRFVHLGIGTIEDDLMSPHFWSY